MVCDFYNTGITVNERYAQWECKIKQQAGTLGTFYKIGGGGVTEAEDTRLIEGTVIPLENLDVICSPKTKVNSIKLVYLLLKPTRSFGTRQNIV